MTCKHELLVPLHSRACQTGRADAEIRGQHSSSSCDSQEKHVKEEVEAKASEKEEAREEPPQLVLLRDRHRVEVQVQRRDKVKVARRRREESEREVRPSDDRHLAVPLLNHDFFQLIIN